MKDAIENNHDSILRGKWKLSGAKHLFWKTNCMLSCECFNWQSIKLAIY
jgi:hypothetical protein